MRHLCCLGRALAQRRVRVDGFADVHGVGADHAAAQNLAVVVPLLLAPHRPFNYT